MTCFILDVPCHANNLWLLISTPTWWHVYAVSVLASAAGAKWGWPVPIGLTTAGLLRFVPLPGRRKETVVTDPDFEPPWAPIPFRKPKVERPPKPQVGRKPGETAADRWRVD